jgi:hypothetical protein
MRKFGPLTAVLIGLLGLFLGLDGVAHLTHYAYGETFSAWVWSLPLWIKPLIGLAVAVLFTHLMFRKP